MAILSRVSQRALWAWSALCYVSLWSTSRSWGASEAWQARWCAAIILKAVDSPTTTIPSTDQASALCAAVKRECSTWQRYRDDLELHHSEHRSPAIARGHGRTHARVLWQKPYPCWTLCIPSCWRGLPWTWPNGAKLSVLAFGPARCFWEVELVDPLFEAM